MLSQKDNFTWKSQNLCSKTAIFSDLPKKFSRFLIDGSMFKMAALNHYCCLYIALVCKSVLKLVIQGFLNRYGPKIAKILIKIVGTVKKYIAGKGLELLSKGVVPRYFTD